MEIWNEPNLKLFWQPWPDPAKFTRLLKVSYSAIKAVNPELPVGAGGFSNLVHNSPGGIGLEPYLRDVYEAGARRYMDAIAFHGYPYSLRDDVLLSYLDTIRRVRDAAGDTGLPLWVTEIGLSTSGGVGVVTEAQQASGLVHFLEVLRAQPDVELVAIHNMVEDAALPGFLGEYGGYGVLRWNLDRKPAYCALAAYSGKGC